eukprot:SAG31_NODE_449_length_15539_cov_21.936658_2_plen_117_part_00
MHLKAISDVLEWRMTRNAVDGEEDEDYVPDGGDDEDYVPDDGGADENEDEEQYPTDEEGNDLLCNAVWEGDVVSAESLVEQGHGIDVLGTAEGDSEKRSLTPLMHAVVSYNSDLVK